MAVTSSRINFLTNQSALFCIITLKFVHYMGSRLAHLARVSCTVLSSTKETFSLTLQVILSALLSAAMAAPQVSGPLTPLVGNRVATPRGFADINLEGFSEDLNQDGFVDPVVPAAPVVHAAPVVRVAAPFVHHAPFVHVAAAHPFAFRHF